MAIQQASIRDEIYEFLASGPSSSEIIAFRPSPSAQRRASELLELNRSQQVSDEDREELDDLVRIEDMIRILKAKARKHIQP